MSKTELRFRQIHLDFHTSEKIPGIARDFNPEEFAATLEKARVNSITCFARGHHGMLYYDSKEFPERIHPHLENKNLLKEQIEACHKRGINAPVYITVQWDYYTAQEHPEWLSLDEKGNPLGTPIYEPGFYRQLCVNTPYRDFLKAQTKEVLENFDVDGIFFDIVQVHECSCNYCRAGMEEKGMDPAKQEDRAEYAQQMINEFKLDMTRFVRQYNSDCTIFYNKGHVGTAHRPVVDAYTHFELESLPSGGWGYLHFPVAMRYARTLGLDCLGMTGKFHTSWGDFHSFKNQAALEFECFQMLALNAKCSIGDQLEPNGKLSEPVYDLIGSVYSQVEAKEPWCKGAEAVTDIGVITPEEFNNMRLSAPIMGITRMLQENGQQFDIIDTKSDLSHYKVIILPDEIPVSETFAGKLEQYINTGGKVIASFESGLNEEQTAYALDKFGVSLRDETTLAADGKPARGRAFARNAYIDYIVPKGEMTKDLYETEYAMYIKGVEIDALADSDVLAEIVLPYFDRTYKHFCSHQQAPSGGKVSHPGIVKNGDVIYFSNPIFTIYNKNAPHWCKKLFINALEMLLPEPLVEHNGPSTLNTTLNKQQAKDRWVLHALHYIPERRSEEIDIIEDVIPLYELDFSVKVQNDVSEVKLAPEGESLQFVMKDDRVEFTLPKLNGHQMVEIDF